MTNSPYAGGSGTSVDPYTICTATQFNNIGANSSHWSGHFKLMDNINMISTSPIVIGNSGTRFTGVLDGNNMTISNYSLTSAPSNSGIFGYIQNSTIQNLFVEGVTITGTNSFYGAIVGNSAGGSTLSSLTLRNGTISGASNVGGIAGILTAETSLTNLSVTGTTTVTATAATSLAGGITGELVASTITTCSSSATLTGLTTTGGIVGRVTTGAASTLTSCTNSGVITGTGSVGGIAGLIAGTSSALTSCTNTGNINGSATGVGGLVGSSSAALTITSANNSGTVNSSSGSVGGILGSATGAFLRTVDSSTNTGNVTGTGATGGIVGFLGTASGSITITSSSSNAAITGGSSTGGLFGGSSTNSNVIIISDSTVAGSVTGVAAGTVGLGGVIGRLNNTIGTQFVFTNTSSSANVTNSSSANHTGGFAGRLSSNQSTNTISGCSATGNVTATGFNVGGFIGSTNFQSNNIGTLTRNFAKGNVSGEGEVGGFIGELTSTIGQSISESYATGNVTALSSSAGGFIGRISSSGSALSISDSFARGNVDAGLADAGGLFGVSSSALLTITNSYAAGATTGTGNIGAFAGTQSGGSFSCTACYFDSTVSALTAFSSGGAAGVTGQSTTNMQTMSVFSGAGWGLTWQLNSSYDGAYPQLTNLPAP